MSWVKSKKIPPSITCQARRWVNILYLKKNVHPSECFIQLFIPPSLIHFLWASLYLERWCPAREPLDALFVNMVERRFGGEIKWSCPQGMLVTVQQSRFMDANSMKQGNHEFRSSDGKWWSDNEKMQNAFELTSTGYVVFLLNFTF